MIAQFFKDYTSLEVTRPREIATDPTFLIFLQFLLNIHLNSSKFFSFIEKIVVRYYIVNQFTNRKAELEADLEAEALTFCWKQKRRKRKRKQLGWKRKR
jgi:hypothetical protein